MNTDNSNNVHSDNSIYNNMDNTINTGNSDINNNISGMEENNNINSPYNNYSNNNATEVIIMQQVLTIITMDMAIMQIIMEI